MRIQIVNLEINLGVNMLGISSIGSSKCIAMLEKVNYMTKLTGGGVIMATGTPITNSITDCYVFQRYLQQGELKLLNIHSFASSIQRDHVRSNYPVQQGHISFLPPLPF